MSAQPQQQLHGRLSITSLRIVIRRTASRADLMTAQQQQQQYDSLGKHNLGQH
jgi:hypothetical protein